MEKDALVSPFTAENIVSIFFQDQYALSDQELLTLGISYNHISRNGGAEDDSLLQFRLGYIYRSDHWSYKAYLYRTQFAIEPLVTLFRSFKLSGLWNHRLQWVSRQEVSYQQGKYNV